MGEEHAYDMETATYRILRWTRHGMKVEVSVWQNVDISILIRQNSPVDMADSTRPSRLLDELKSMILPVVMAWLSWLKKRKSGQAVF